MLSALSTAKSSGCVGRVFASDLDDLANGTVFYWRDTVTPSVEASRSANTVHAAPVFDVDTQTGLICTNQSSPPAVGQYYLGVSYRFIFASLFPSVISVAHKLRPTSSGFC